MWSASVDINEWQLIFELQIPLFLCNSIRFCRRCSRKEWRESANQRESISCVYKKHKRVTHKRVHGRWFAKLTEWVKWMSTFSPCGSTFWLRQIHNVRKTTLRRDTNTHTCTSYDFAPIVRTMSAMVWCCLSIFFFSFYFILCARKIIKINILFSTCSRKAFGAHRRLKQQNPVK